MIFSCFECGFNTIDQCFLDDHLASEHSNRIPDGPNIMESCCRQKHPQINPYLTESLI